MERHEDEFEKNLKEILVSGPFKLLAVSLGRIFYLLIQIYPIT